MNLHQHRRLARIVVACLTAAAVSVACAEASSDVSSRQRIVVSAPRSDSTTGTLTAYQRSSSGWDVVFGPMRADLGELGVGAPADDVFRTPVGTFPLGQAFGRQPNPGSAMPYLQTTDEDWWDEDVSSPTYDQHVRTANLSWSDDAENLYDSGAMYDYAVVMEHNPQRVPGKSAGVFLHVTTGDPTWGCVAIERESMRKVLNWLDPRAHPLITVGVDAPPPPS